MIYIHTPFCKKKCVYCDFNSYAGVDHLIKPYVDALLNDISNSENIFSTVKSIYIGGGTPSLIGANNIKMILETLKDKFCVAKDVEISIEANPESIYLSDLLKLRESGVNRLSIGFQSISDKNLSLLGRIHDSNKAEESFILARTAGFDNINIDMIYGLPGQSLKDWKEELECVMTLGPEHLSLYPLSLEEGTPLKKMVDDNWVEGIDEDKQADMMDVTFNELLKDRSRGRYRHYEISNYAIEGYDCRHNLSYWSSADYLGFGAGAHSHRQGRRWWNVKEISDYIERLAQGSDPKESEERLSKKSRIAESIFLGLRTIKGVNIDNIEEKFDVDILEMYECEIKGLIDNGLVELGSTLRLTKRGQYFANWAMSVFV